MSADARDKATDGLDRRTSRATAQADSGCGSTNRTGEGGPDDGCDDSEEPVEPDDQSREWNRICLKNAVNGECIGRGWLVVTALVERVLIERAGLTAVHIEDVRGRAGGRGGARKSEDCRDGSMAGC